jgi:hypothetical protein
MCIISVYNNCKYSTNCSILLNCVDLTLRFIFMPSMCNVGYYSLNVFSLLTLHIDCIIAKRKVRILNDSVIVINYTHYSMNKLFLSFKRKYLKEFRGALSNTFISLNSEEFI